MDKLRALQTFVQIVESGSLSAAAEHLDTSPTSVVRSLSALEKALGVRLLNRTTRRMALTDEGREYFARCQRVLGDLEEAESALLARRVEASGRLVITAPVMFGRMHVAPLVNEFLADFPAVRVELLLLDRMVDLLEEGIDLAIRIGKLPDSTQIAVPLGMTHRIICASPAYLARHGTPMRPEELARHRCIRVSGSSAGPAWHFQMAGIDKSVDIGEVFATNHNDLARDACEKGVGCGRFLAYQVREQLAGGALVRILQDFETPAIPVQIAYPHARLLPSRVRAFIDRAAPRLRQVLAD